jgi:hypothetical protein
MLGTSQSHALRAESGALLGQFTLIGIGLLCGFVEMTRRFVE